MMIGTKKHELSIIGATLTLANADSEEKLTALLEGMKRDGFNTVNVYALEEYKFIDHFFTELARLQLYVVVRIEAYSDDFAFKRADIGYILEKYEKLLNLVCVPGNARCVRYFALNMPVDDPAVQVKFGGVNTATCIESQVDYAQYFVAAMRDETGRRGFESAKLFLSVFYGWDNSFNTPGYKAAGADGYFLNNYSYPKTNTIPHNDMEDEDLINAERLSVSIGKFQNQYRGKPLVIEFGFHTLEYNGGEKPDQTAGLVDMRKTKKRAIEATHSFYEGVDECTGYLYFGYNLYKKEGIPPAVMDWTYTYDEGEI